jgi:solute carrier family 12 sodium/potassium/chloride transporter 2
MENKQVMELMSLFGPLIYAGCFAATLSSALSCLVSGPKTFQALCKDHVYPYLTRFGVGYGKSDDPYWSYALGFVIALIFILIGKFNGDFRAVEMGSYFYQLGGHNYTYIPLARTEI